MSDYDFSGLPAPDPEITQQNALEEKYGGIGQQLKTAAEGAAQGIVGPLAPAIERGLGVKSEDILNRAKTNPLTHGVSEAAGLGTSLLVPGLGEYSLAGQAANLGEHAAALLPEVAPKFLALGVRTGAEMAALATSDEISKAVEKDPNQSFGTAVANVGLAGLIGGVAGGGLGAVSSLWNKARNLSGVEKLVTDFQAETEALNQAKQAASAPAEASYDEVVNGKPFLNTNPLKAKEPLFNWESPGAPKTEEFEAIPASRSNKSPGVLLARWVNEKGAAAIAKAMGESASSTLGASLGALVGHPLAGAWMGEKALGQVFTSLAKPLAENALDSAAAKGAVEYVGNILKGDKIVSDGVASLFKTSGEVLAKDLIPDQSERNKLEKSLEFYQNGDNALRLGGNIGHYLPGHATAAAETTATAINYLNNLKPKEPEKAPFDSKPPVDKEQQNKYHRALDVAQQPMVALQHTKNGTLTAQDVNTLQTLYPGLHRKIVQLATNQMIGLKDPSSIPYSRRVSLNLLIGGTPLDSTMTPMAMQSIINTASPKSQQMAQDHKNGGTRNASSTTLNQLNKVNKIYSTPLQSRQLQKRS